ncbi:hypothetical protein BDV96DRAFT_653320 [Lophiotrema nucula]|uniref:Lysine-specific metallo-endopeptidase domain-containing protein n=1 Tax=Lophiotrema nucula TaxID=690887 RepID=A0A6A5YM83_9PLEO|nr:hypothetical protein BDV96DRAFT_653320 [Lophiotrema nucula]
MTRNLCSLVVTIVSSLLVNRTCALPTVLEGSAPAEELANLTARQDGVDTSAIHYDFQGCDGPGQQDAVKDAWKELLMLGAAVNADIDWDAQATTDFLGSKSNNQAYQTEIQAILKNIVTWKDDGTILSWKLEVHCDDYLRHKEAACPGITKPEDEDKCGSRCWRGITFRNANGQLEVARWVPRAAAYTTDHEGDVKVAAINFCPSFFDMDGCQDRMNKNINQYPEGSDDRLNLNNYQCKGYVALHELFHINSATHRVADRVKHVHDRSIKIRGLDGRINQVLAYGPTYTRTLARWTLNTGFWVVTNADNLAQYALSVWATSQAGAYPRFPEIKDTDRPISRPTFFGTQNDNGVISQNTDPEIMGQMLGVPAEDAYDTYLREDLGCSDNGEEGSTIDPCVDDNDNPAQDLAAIPQNGEPFTTLYALLCEWELQVWWNGRSDLLCEWDVQATSGKKIWALSAI